jgi:hypothetical protein
MQKLPADNRRQYDGSVTMPAPSEIVYRHLVHYLGPHTTRTALKTFCTKAVHKAPEALTLDDMPNVLSALRPMMRTLLGAKESEQVLAQITYELRL